MGERVCDVDETIDANRGTHLVSADQRNNVAINNDAAYSRRHVCMGWQQKKSWNETVLLTVGDIDIISLELPRDSPG